MKIDPTLLLATIDALKKDPGENVLMDWNIACVLGEVPAHTFREVGFDYDWYRTPGWTSLRKAIDSEGRNQEVWIPLRRTFSKDAAFSDIPPGWTVGHIQQSDNKWWSVELRKGFLTSYSKVIIVGSDLKCGKLQIVLTIANLQARLQDLTDVS